MSVIHLQQYASSQAQSGCWSAQCARLRDMQEKLAVDS